MMRRVVAAILVLLVPPVMTACAALQEPPVQTAPPPPPPPPRVMLAPPPRQADVWPDGRVPLCFEAPAEDDQWAREQVLTAAATWQAAARVRFDIVADCAAVPVGSGRHIPVRIVHNPALFASASHLGNNLLRGGSITLNADYLVTNRICGRRPARTNTVWLGRTRCFYADSLHELGHALGFTHDHVSAGAPNCRARMTTPEATNADETYYDPRSIMNYCNDDRWKGQLSPADLCSVRFAYGALVGDRPTRSDCYALAASGS